jgi:hypothetical protein
LQGQSAPTPRKTVVALLLAVFAAVLIIALAIVLTAMRSFPRPTKTNTDYYYGEIWSQCMSSAPLKDPPPVAQFGNRDARNKRYDEKMETDTKNRRYCNCIVVQAAKRLPPLGQERLDVRSPEATAKLAELAGLCMAEIQ